MGRRPQRGTHVAYGAPGTLPGIRSRVGIHDRDHWRSCGPQARVAGETRQDDLDLGPVVDHAHDAIAARPRLTLADRFRLAYAAIYAAWQYSRRNPRCLG